MNLIRLIPVLGCTLLLGCETPVTDTSLDANDEQLSFAKGGKGGGRTDTANPELAFFSGDSNISVSNADGSNSAVVARSSSWRGAPSWAPDGSGTVTDPYRIVFTLEEFTDGTRIRFGLVEIAVVDDLPTASREDTIVVGAPFGTCCVDHADWSPLGDRIVFHNGGIGTDPMYTVPAWPGLQTPTSLGIPGGWPVWSRDASRIAFTAHNSDLNETAIEVLNLNTNEVWTVLPAGSIENIRWLDWANTRDALVFSGRSVGPAGKGGKQNCESLYTVELDLIAETAGQPVKLTCGSMPSWSPDDTKIVYSDGIYDLGAGKREGRNGYETADWRH